MHVLSTDRASITVDGHLYSSATLAVLQNRLGPMHLQVRIDHFDRTYVLVLDPQENVWIIVPRVGYPVKADCISYYDRSDCSSPDADSDWD